MATCSSTSSSLLILFIDTNLDTHFTFTIDGHQSIAQLKGRIVSEHANCFPAFGEISVMAVKAKIGEFFYHLSDSMILNCFFQGVEGAKRFQVDIVCVSSTVKSSDQIKMNSDARMHNGQLENLEHLNCKSGDGASALFDAKMKEKAQFDTSLKDSRYFKPRRTKKNEVSSNENNTSVDDSLPKINGTPSENPPEVILLKETISICNNKYSNSYKSEILQLSTSMKDSSDLKHLMKKEKKASSNEENPLANDSSHVMHRRKKKKKVASNEDDPLVNNSMQKICDSASGNPPKEIFPKKTIRNSGGNGIDSNKSETLASVSERSSRYDLQPIESVVQANVADKQKRSEKFAEVPPPQIKLVNSTLGDVHLCINSEIAVEHGDSSMGKVNDASHENRTKTDVDAHIEKKLSETDEDKNHNRIHEAPVQLDTNTPMKDPTDPKHKRKVKKKISRNKEHSANPLVEDSLHNINDIRANNQPKESILKETISNCNDFGNESGIAASIKESSQPSTVQHVELLLQANVDDTHNRKGKVVYVPSPSKPLSTTSCDLDSSMHETDVSSTGLLNCHNTATDKMLKHEHIKENSTGYDPTTQFSNDLASQIPKERFILGLAVSLKETTSEATGKHGAENIARLVNNIKEIAPTQKRRQKRVIRKIPSSRLGNQSKKSNEDESVPTFVQSEKNDGSGSNMHDTEKAKSGSHTKDDSNVNLDNTKTVPEKRRKRQVFSCPVGVNKGASSSGCEN